MPSSPVTLTVIDFDALTTSSPNSHFTEISDDRKFGVYKSASKQIWDFPCSPMISHGHVSGRKYVQIRESCEILPSKQAEMKVRSRQIVLYTNDQNVIGDASVTLGFSTYPKLNEHTANIYEQMIVYDQNGRAKSKQTRIRKEIQVAPFTQDALIGDGYNIMNLKNDDKKLPNPVAK